MGSTFGVTLKACPRLRLDCHVLGTGIYAIKDVKYAFFPFVSKCLSPLF